LPKLLNDGFYVILDYRTVTELMAGIHEPINQKVSGSVIGTIPAVGYRKDGNTDRLKLAGVVYGHSCSFPSGGSASGERRL